MEDRLAHLEAAISEMSASLRKLESRVLTLENGATRQQSPAPAGEIADERPGRSESAADSPGHTLASVLSLLGRACLVFCGAFLLRAITDAGTIAQSVGVAIGLAYAVFWMGAAELAGRRGRRLSAEFHGLVAVLIAFPLLVESTVNFKVLSPGLAALALAFLSAIGLVIGWRQRLPALVWGCSVASVSAILLLIRFTRVEASFALIVVLIGVVTLWAAQSRGWSGLSWFTATAANIVVLHLSVLTATPGGARPPWQPVPITTGLGITLGLFVAYLGSFAIQALLKHRKMSLFEVVQTAAVLIIGLGGAARIVDSSGSGAVILGAIVMALAAASYAVSFASIDRRLGRGANFLFFTTLALILMLYGSSVALPSAASVILWCGLGLAAALLGGHFDRVTLRAHASLYLLAAAMTTDLMTTARAALLAPADAMQSPSALGLTVLAASLVSYLVLAATQAGTDTPWQARLPRFTVALIALAGIGGLLILMMTSVLVTGTGDEGMLASVRSVVLAVSALGLAAIGRRRVIGELSWFVYPLLIAGGGKLLLVDMQTGRPATLFLAFAAYGIALIIAPRLMKKAAPVKTL